MDFSSSPASKLTERIMSAIGEHLRPDAPGQLVHYNRVYEHVHRLVLADMLVANLARKHGFEVKGSR